MTGFAKLAAGAVALAAVAAAGFFTIAAPIADGRFNKIVPHEPYAVGAEARALHETLRVADLHADLLLWPRDPLRRSKRGHTDVPRLSEGGFRLQVFSAVTKTPKNLNYDRNSADSDSLTTLVIAARWPMRTWSSLAERALFEAEKLSRAADRSSGKLTVVRTRSELEAALSGDGLAAILATEGAHPLEGDLANLDRLYDAGYRVLGLHHFFDNELGGSLHGVSHAGLTEFGREAVRAAEAKGMIIDVAHSSEAVVRAVLDIAEKPIIVSHTGLFGRCPKRRNISDELMQAIAASGGLIGVGFWDEAACGTAPQAIAKAIVYGVDLVGPDHIALGSDFDGATTTSFDAAEIAVLTEALQGEGLAPEVIAKVMGENQIRFFLENL